MAGADLRFWDGLNCLICNPRELQAKSDLIVATVAKRIRDGGQDPNAVIEAQKAQFKLKLVTTPGLAPTYVAYSVSEALQKRSSQEHLADGIVAQWRAQKLTDEAVRTS